MDNHQNNIDQLFSEESKLAEENTTFPGFEKVWEKVEHRLEEKQTKTRVLPTWFPYAIAASLAIIFGSIYFLNRTEKVISDPFVKINIPNKVINENDTEITSSSTLVQKIDNIKNIEKKIQQNIKTKTLENKPILAINSPKISHKETELVPQINSVETAVSAPNENFVSNNYAVENKGKEPEPETVKSIAMLKKIENPVAKSALDLQQNRVFATESSTDEAMEEEIFEDVKISMNKNEPPLYIVDGYIADTAFLKNYNAKKITSLNIVEGKSAVQLYGNYGKKGVVVITTKGLTNKEKSELKENSVKYNLPN